MAIKLETAQICFLSDVFAAEATILAHASYYCVMKSSHQFV